MYQTVLFIMILLYYKYIIRIISLIHIYQNFPILWPTTTKSNPKISQYLPILSIQSIFLFLSFFPNIMDTLLCIALHATLRCPTSVMWDNNHNVKPKKIINIYPSYLLYHILILLPTTTTSNPKIP